MKILICSDGTAAADNAIALAKLLASPLQAETTLLGIAEKSDDEEPLRQALEKQVDALRDSIASMHLIVQYGEPVRQIVDLTAKTEFDLVVIGARWTGATGQYWRSVKTYDVIKSVTPPVLVAIGESNQLRRFLVCTGGKEFAEQPVQLSGQIAAAVGASITLLHVMAEPPGIYADLISLEEDVDRLLESKSELGLNLCQQKKELDRLGVKAEVRLRHGIVIDQVFEEAGAGDCDMIVTGTSQTRGLLGHYIMGDLTRSIVNRANCPVLVARAGKGRSGRTFGAALKRLFASKAHNDPV
ncbi:MAG: universal stress protein [Chthoniobacterales bacterium]